MVPLVNINDLYCATIEAPPPPPTSSPNFDTYIILDVNESDNDVQLLVTEIVAIKIALSLIFFCYKIFGLNIINSFTKRFIKPY
jgi:hypothetical protein